MPTPKAGEPTRQDNGLVIQDVVVGTGKIAENGDTLNAHYVGTLESGTVFDESYGRGQPIQFVLGSGQLIQGWELGLIGMKEGGKRKLIIPPELGYGARGAGDIIPPNSTLLFEIELVSVTKK
ncbi:MAG: peptidylprolyl isomerase [Candidatus Yanofskybacteria bacterium RIFCSPHIGHO2_01_FULL_43_42]|uniref:Peptidyl-prolyl cis-trans isomerase n=1 Tax=Candidatus Yanofskybacteria bacterium RIFCSPLOWO2_01_FULL_43_22 TaxID=1802695 RepID=A0A1F8GHF3_9BACT|nr:MAG: peptidylprolyl isomerase [Candidatus Yanofskybacteria bacterium RIFCSPHIGHO2_01_FULL_43_42]OGN13315.1 MAG: peptidylprolyl isomerase [Candidatus Yanofskybacteria bacterium RIFCSPHIGHO2_02_FULL_43_17]OGN24731.1 MAG: peptidylprolyl isomerase [Candidatus Yanofskybacteria bacterium RIFCSPLOWO2_01_FULL_43_22]